MIIVVILFLLFPLVQLATIVIAEKEEQDNAKSISVKDQDKIVETD